MVKVPLAPTKGAADHGNCLLGCATPFGVLPAACVSRARARPGPGAGILFRVQRRSDLRSSPRSLLCALAALAATPLPAQNVLNVGPGGFPQIQPAITAAAPGDIVVVAAGTYEAFQVDKALTITAAPGAGVTIDSTVFGGAAVDFRIPSGTARVSGLAFRSPQPFFFGLKVTVRQGIVWFEDCVFEQGTHIAGAALEVSGSAAVLRGCTAFGSGGPNNSVAPAGAAGGTALLADRSWVSATDCVFVGGDLHHDFGGQGGHGVDAVGSALHLVRCTASGGQNATAFGQCAFYDGGHGVLVRSPLDTWIADSALAGGGGNCGFAGDALRNLGTRPVALARTTAVGGAGAVPGASITGPVTQAPLLGLASAPPPLALGSVWQVTFRAANPTPVLVIAAFDLAPRGDPLAVQHAWLDPAGTFLLGVALPDPLGNAPFALPLPASPSLLHATAWVQGVTGTALPLQTTPPLGGVAR